MRFGQPEKRPRAQRTQEKVKQQGPVVRPKRTVQPEGLTEESQIDFDPIEGHHHDGADSRAVPLSGDVTGANTSATVEALQGVPVAAPTVDDDGRVPQYSSTTNSITWEPPLKAHNLLSVTHTDTTPDTAVRGDLVAAQGSPAKFARLALGASGTVLRSNGTDVAWSTDAHNLLSARHGDTTAGTVARGDLIAGQGATPKFARLALGATGTVVKSNGTDVSWGQVAFSELTGSLSAAQHGTQASTAGSTADHTGTLSANARLQAQKNGTNVGSPRPTFNFEEGANVTLTVTDTGSVVKVNIAASGVTSHALLSATHADVTAGSPVRGDLITAQGTTPAWGRLALGLSGRYLRSNGTDAAWAQIPHTDLTYSGLTAGQVLKASGASAASFASLSTADLSYSGLAAGQVLRATSATAASFGQLLHAQLGSIGADDHHSQAHVFFGSDHSDVSGTPAAGAIIYRNGSSQWVPLPVGSTDQILKVSGGGLPVWAAATSVATARAPVYGWRRANISSGADLTFKEMPGFDAVNTGERMAYSGTLVGISVVLDGDIGTAGQDYTVECYRATSDVGTYAATGVTCTIFGGGGTERSASATGFSVPFNAGDILTVFDKRTNGVNGRSSKCHLLVVFN